MLEGIQLPNFPAFVEFPDKNRQISFGYLILDVKAVIFYAMKKIFTKPKLLKN
jgi:hypothetical protein